MAIADALSLSYIMLNVMCQVLSLVMLGRTSTDIGRHTEQTYFRWLLITFVLYCVADSVPVLSQVGFITPQARLFALELSIVLISFMAYLWYKFAEAHLLPTERPSKVVGMLEAVPFVLLIAAFILCIPTDYLAYVRGGSVWRGRYYSFLMIPSILYLAAMSIRAFAMASRERVRSRVVDELLIVQFSAAPTIGAVVDELVPGTPVMSSAVFLSIMMIFFDLQRSRIYTDALTGLNNRRRLREYYDQIAQGTEQGRARYAFCLCDVDLFKRVNDKYGHLVGDQVLIMTAQALAAVASRRRGFVARWGGDEFVLIVEAPSEGVPEGIGRQVNAAMRQISKNADLPMEVTVSVGVTCCETGESLEEVLARADKLMYESKIASHERDRVEKRKYGSSAQVVAAQIEERQMSLQEEMSGTSDSLTGLPGLEALRLAVAGAYGADADDYAGGPVLVAFDIENFKTFNLTYGFEGGDMLLRSVARLLVEAFPGRCVIRMSEDHFFAVTDYEGIEAKILRVHERAHDFRRDVNIELKVGVYPLTDPDESVSAACDAARLACNSIKRRSDWVYRVYDEQLGNLVSRRRYIVDNLDRALTEGWIKVYYQPVVRVQTGRVCGLEALARWEDPVHGLLAPGVFIGTLEDYHLIHKLDMHVLRLACADYRRSADAGKTPLPFSVNLSRLDFELCDVTRAVEEATRDFGVPASMLEIEVTESILGGDAGSVHKKLGEFRRNGFQVWMDDFGSGYSSLNLLKDYSFDVLKIDMLFLRDFSATSSRLRNTRIVVASIVDMAKQLGIQTLAEGVETDEHLAFLRRVGCEKAQGYLFSKPRPRDELFAVLKEKGIGFEEASQHAYYDRVGRVNLLGTHLVTADDAARDEARSGIVSTPMGVVEVLDGRRFNLLASNDALDSFLASTEIGNEYQMDTGEVGFGSITLYTRLIAAFSAAVSVRGEQQIDIIRGSRFCTVRFRFIAECEGHAACLATVQDLSELRSTSAVDELSSALGSLCEVFTRIDLVALDDSFAKSIYVSSSRYRPFLIADDAKWSIARYAEENVHPDDREAFVAFYDLDTVADRISESGRGYLNEIFRTRETDGAYRDQVYMLVPHTSEGRDCVLSFVRDA